MALLHLNLSCLIRQTNILPIVAELNNLPRIGKLSFLAIDLLVRIATAAPSVIYDELPPVDLPSLLKAGFSLASYSRVVGLAPSSLSITISVTLPCLSLIVVLTGVIS